LKNIRKDAVAALSEQERPRVRQPGNLKQWLGGLPTDQDRHFVKEWQMSVWNMRCRRFAWQKFRKRKAAYNDAQCFMCHRLGNDGGSIGPELTAASSKYSRREILESIWNFKSNI